MEFDVGSAFMAAESNLRRLTTDLGVVLLRHRVGSGVCDFGWCAHRPKENLRLVEELHTNWNTWEIRQRVGEWLHSKVTFTVEEAAKAAAMVSRHGAEVGDTVPFTRS
jgi:hypothetical protein